MVRIAVCDDQSAHLKKVIESAEEYFRKHPEYQARIEGFGNSASFLETLGRSGGWDIVILDICMPGISGTEIAREIRKRHDHTGIIFISASSDYAVDAFALNAVHYVLKPFSGEQFEEAMTRALQPFSEKKPKRIILHLENGAVRNIDIDDISYIESIAYRRIVHASTGKYEEMRKTLSAFLSELDDMSPGQFIQPYRGYIVNLNAIRTITPEYIVMNSGERILIKRGDFRRLRSLFFDWSFRGDMHE